MYLLHGRDLFSGEEGQSLGEYTLILVLVLVATVGAVTAFGAVVLALYEKILAVF